MDSCVGLRDHAFDHALSFCRRSSTAVRVRRSADKLTAPSQVSVRPLTASVLPICDPDPFLGGRPVRPRWPAAARASLLITMLCSLISNTQPDWSQSHNYEKSHLRASRVLPSAADPGDQRLLLDIRWHAQRPSRLTYSLGPPPRPCQI